MTASSALLRQIFNDARPLVEQALDLTEQFAAFRDLATQNGFDWSQIKALLKAEVQDERNGDGSKRVDRIIEKADFASAYADMLGLGSASANMNENNFSSELPDHDEETGELTEVPATRPVSATAPVAGGEPAKGDAGETTRLGIALNEPCTDASPTTSQIPQGVASETEAAIEPQASVSQINPESATPSPVAVEPVSAAAPTSDPGSSFPDDLEVPLFLRREKAA